MDAHEVLPYLCRFVYTRSGRDADVARRAFDDAKVGLVRHHQVHLLHPASTAGEHAGGPTPART